MAGVSSADPDAEIQVLTELEGNDREAVLADTVRLSEMALQLGAEEPLVADNPTDRERLWKARRSLAKTLKEIYPEVIAEDIVVPLSQLPATVARTAELAKQHGLVVVPFGHIGDGNIHVDVCRDQDREPWLERAERFTDELMDFVLSRGSQVSAEHGIGCEKKRWMTRALGKPELDLMRTLKRALDPDNVLNPGKVLPD